MPSWARSPGMTDRRGRSGGPRHYPRTTRVNEVLREVLADELERLEHGDARLGQLTVTAVEAEPDLHHATVFLSSLPADAADTLGGHRVRLQAAVARQVR